LLQTLLGQYVEGWGRGSLWSNNAGGCKREWSCLFEDTAALLLKRHWRKPGRFSIMMCLLSGPEKKWIEAGWTQESCLDHMCSHCSDFIYLFSLFSGVGCDWVHLARRPPSSGWWMSVEYLVECELTVETEVLGGNLPKCYFVNHKSHMNCSGIEPGPQRWEAGDWPPKIWKGLPMH
jgi:hypothetical protein